jgi:hypothetical protein
MGIQLACCVERMVVLEFLDAGDELCRENTVDYNRFVEHFAE